MVVVRDVLAEADGIQQGRQMGLGLEGTDSALGGNVNRSGTSIKKRASKLLDPCCDSLAFRPLPGCVFPSTPG
jgi:hypothetical protein